MLCAFKKEYSRCSFPIDEDTGVLQDGRYVCLVALHAVPTALRIKEIEWISAQHPELQTVRNCLAKANGTMLLSQVCNDLIFIGHVILRGTRIVVPQSLGKRVVSLAHEGHQGVSRQRKGLEQRSGGPEWTVTQREDAWSATTAS